MKIGILTYPLNNNYGCYLQSYALLHFLKEKGYDVEYIMRRHDKPSLAVYIKYAIKTICISLCRMSWENPIYDYEWHYMMNKGARLYSFFHTKIIPHTEPIYSSRKLAAVCKRYDTIIVGSDQVWRAEILSNIEDYFLTFEKNTNRNKIAYAASFGNEKPGYTSKQISVCGKALVSFKAVSVREKAGLRVMSEYGWIHDNCKVVVDPTLLILQEEYKLLASKPLKNPIVFAYILDDNQYKREIVNIVSKQLSIESLNILEGVSKKDFVYPSIEEWLSYFISASFVVTDSYHGVVFSIIFNKPFAVIINKERGAARFETLLEGFGLTNRVVSNGNNIGAIMESNIDWATVNNTLNQKRSEAIDFLISNL